MRAQWEAEKESIKRVQAVRGEIEQVRRQIAEAERQYDLNKAAELTHGRLPQLERKSKEEEDRLAAKHGAGRLLSEEVTEEEIAEIVSRWTGVPRRAAGGRGTRQTAPPGGGPAPPRRGPG